jgi:hypothetical protein
MFHERFHQVRGMSDGPDRLKYESSFAALPAHTHAQARTCVHQHTFAHISAHWQGQLSIHTTGEIFDANTASEDWNPVYSLQSDALAYAQHQVHRRIRYTFALLHVALVYLSNAKTNVCANFSSHIRKSSLKKLSLFSEPPVSRRT